MEYKKKEKRHCADVFDLSDVVMPKDGAFSHIFDLCFCFGKWILQHSIGTALSFNNTGDSMMSAYSRDDCGTLLWIISRIWLVNERFWKQHDTSKWYFNFQRNRCMCWFWFWFSLWFWIERISTKRAEQSIARIVRVDCESNHAFRIKINQHKQPQRETVKTAGLPITVDNQAHTQCLAIGNTSKTWALILYASFDAIIISAKPFQ